MIAKFRAGQIARDVKENTPVRVVKVDSVIDGYSTRAAYKVENLLSGEKFWTISKNLKKVSKQSVGATIGNIRRWATNK